MENLMNSDDGVWPFLRGVLKFAGIILFLFCMIMISKCVDDEMDSQRYNPEGADIRHY